MNILLITVRADFGGGPRHVHQLIEELPSDFNIYVAFPTSFSWKWCRFIFPNFENNCAAD